MAIYPAAIWRPIQRNYTRRVRTVTRGVILHVAVSEASSIHGWFNNPAARASSHFYVRRDGTVEQYVDTIYSAWTSGAANWSTIGIETQGMGHGAWTPAQEKALADLIVWLHKVHRIPPRLMASSKAGERGVGWHKQGVPATYAQKVRGVSQTGGQLWSPDIGKICPGPQRIPQIPGIVKRAATGKPAPPPAAKPAPAKPKHAKPTTYAPLLVDGHAGPVTVTAWQILLAECGYYRGAIDGIFGPLTIKAMQTWLRTLKFYNGYVDGIFGPLTIRALQRFLKAKRLYKGLIDGRREQLTVKAEQAYLNQQRQYL